MLRHVVYASLLQFGVETASLKEAPRWAKVDRAVKEMRNSGNSFLAGFVDAEKLQRLQTLLCNALPMSRQGREKPGRITLVLAVEDVDLIGLPVESWPLLPRSTARPSTISSPMELEESLLEFPGFAAVIARRLCREFNTPLVIERRGPARLPPTKIVSFKDFYRLDDALAKTSDAVWLAKAVGETEEAIWPDDVIHGEDATQRLVRCLSDPRRSFDPAEPLRGYADQIQHFSCHFSQESGTDGWLTLRAERNSASGMIPLLRVAIEDIKSGLVDCRPVLAEIRSIPGPLLFMNACASGAINSSGTLSLLEALLKWTPARAILVTETEVHYPFAADFARRVYKRLFYGEPLGRAFHAARWDLVIAKQNPFGFLYTLYGNPDIYMENLVPERVAA